MAAAGFLSVTPVEPLSLPPSIGQEVDVTTASMRRGFDFSFRAPPWGRWRGGAAEMPGSG